MKKVLTTMVLLGGVGAFAGCGGKQKAPTKDPKTEVNQLITLYDSARPKFVVQKQAMITAEDCSRATRLRGAIDQIAADAAMSPDSSPSVTKVQMELQQAEKECLAK